MKLNLSSFRVGSNRDVLRDLVGHTGRAALIFNACDVYEERLRRWDAEANDLAALGFEPEELDLRSHFDDFEGLKRRVESVDLLWVVLFPLLYLVA